MKICFVLPKYSRQPIGGFKIVFEYANRLFGDGHEVSIIFINKNICSGRKMPYFLKKTIATYFTYREPTWFDLSKHVEKLSGLNKRVDECYGMFDCVIATSASTVDYVMSNFEQSNKVYLIQGYETWDNEEAYLKYTYALGMKNIVVASWLQRIVDVYGRSEAVLIKNPIDTNVYRVTNSIENRNPYSIGMLFHTASEKGCQYAWKAVEKMKRKYPQITLTMFGAHKPERKLPDWVRFVYKASQEQTVQIYNGVSIFICASVEEGFGLTGLEAMCCGAVLVSTQYQGVNEYAIHENNALLCPVKDVESLAKNGIRVIEDRVLRLRLSENGVRTGKDFGWDEAYGKFVEVVEKI